MTRCPRGASLKQLYATIWTVSLRPGIPLDTTVSLLAQEYPSMRVRPRDSWYVESFRLTNAAHLDRYVTQGRPLNVQALEHRAEERRDSSVAAGAGVCQH